MQLFDLAAASASTLPLAYRSAAIVRYPDHSLPSEETRVERLRMVGNGFLGITSVDRRDRQFGTAQVCRKPSISPIRVPDLVGNTAELCISGVWLKCGELPR